MGPPSDNLDGGPTLVLSPKCIKYLLQKIILKTRKKIAKSECGIVKKKVG